MKRVEGNTLQEAYLSAAKEMGCSITELEINIIQNSSSGFLGMFKKTAIIEVAKKGAKKQQPRKNRERKSEKRSPKPQKDIANEEKRQNKHKPKAKKASPNQQSFEKHNIKKEENVNSTPKIQKREPRKKELKIDMEKIVQEVKIDINRLFDESCFEMDKIKVEKYNDNTILIEYSGEDAALLIGKEGYRYKALSYFLYNWINIKYGANVRLEIAEFLKNQEEMIGKYLVSVIQRVQSNGRGQTKILDGVLIKIALEKLREEFPEKYVGIKSARSGGRLIVINDFNRKTK